MTPPRSVMVVGGGSAREHAILRALSQSPNVGRILYVPGNSAVEHLSGVESAPIASQDLDGLVELAQMEEIDLTVVGPNTPLVMGLVDKFRAQDLKIFGPHRVAARLEGSKAFSKNFMLRTEIPTARFGVFEDTERAIHFCRRSSWARVVKTDGLAYEKGVEVCHSIEQCEAAIQRIMVDEVLDSDRQARVVIEERLEGPEITVCVLTDGHDVLVMDANLNYPRALDNNEGMRTRGMGAVSPAPQMTQELLEQIEQTIVIPAVRGLTDYGPPLIGALFIDIILQEGCPYVLDFNVRFGDPATQVMIARLQSDLFELLEACLNGSLAEYRHRIRVDPRVAVSVVLATGGYPEVRRRDDPVTIEPGIWASNDWTLDVGAMRYKAGQLLTTGGRVVTVTALADDLQTAIAGAYQGVNHIDFEGVHYRRDIGNYTPLD